MERSQATLETLPLTTPRSRFAESVKWLPVIFVSSIIGGLYLVYMRLHVVRRLAFDSLVRSTTLELMLFNVVTILLVICYVRCIQIDPGTIPHDDTSWVPLHQADGLDHNTAQEWKRSGDRRQCKWCAKYKPDRCHHCRVCRTCVLKMDHHCPWIYNCVGFKNHKYFFLLLLYTSIDCNIIVWTMMTTVSEALQPSTPFLTMFFLLFSETLAAFLGVIVTLFFSFHIYLMLRSMTTIEYCEKSTKRAVGYDPNVYDRGPLGNIKAVLGEDVWLWFLPMSPPLGNGLNFVTEETALLAKDAEIGSSSFRSPVRIEPKDAEIGSSSFRSTVRIEPKARAGRQQGGGGTGGQSDDDCS